MVSEKREISGETVLTKISVIWTAATKHKPQRSTGVGSPIWALVSTTRTPDTALGGHADQHRSVEDPVAEGQTALPSPSRTRAHVFLGRSGFSRLRDNQRGEDWERWESVRPGSPTRTGLLGRTGGWLLCAHGARAPRRRERPSNTGTARLTSRRVDGF